MRHSYLAIRSNIGSISSGTMRTEDLIPAFLAELTHQRPLSKLHRALVREIESRIWDEHMTQREGYFDSDDAATDLESLFDALESYCLPYFHFGANPGDGADYGYWLSESFQEDFDGLKIEDLSELEDSFASGFVGEVLVVNDHGNMTLYNRGRNHHLYELWSIV